jgi:hypothetical protein
MPSISLSLDDAPFGSDLSMRGLTPQAPEGVPSMFDSPEVKVLYQPDGGEG